MEAVQEQDASQEQLQQLIDQMLEQGGTLGELKGFSIDELEAIYSLAYNMHAQGKFEDAEKMFQFLSLYNHLDKRFWMGLGACRQELKNYQGAVDAYSYIGLLDFDNPYPPLHAADCYMAMGDMEKAESGFKAALHWAGDDEQYADLRGRAQMLLEVVTKNIEDNKEQADVND